MFWFTGWWVVMVARGWLVLQMTDSAFMVGLVTFSALIPQLIFSPLAGVIVDRVNRRNLVIAARGVGALIALFLAVLTGTGMLEVWHIIVLSFLAGVGRSVDVPGVQSLVPNLVSREDLLNAIALNTLARNGTQVLGPLAAGPMIAILGIQACFYLGAGAYALSTWVTTRVITVPSDPATLHANLWHNLREGFQYIPTNPTALFIIVLVSGHCTLTMSTDAILPTFARDILGGDASTFSLIVVSLGLGGLGGTLILASLGNFNGKGLLLLVTTLGSGLTPIFLAGTSWYLISLVAAFSIGAGTSSYMAVSNTIIQSVIPDRLRGRVMSVYMMLAGGLMSIGNLVMGAVGSLWGVPLALALFGGLWLIFSLAVMLRRPFLMRLS